MYVEEIVSKRKGKIYKTILVRESYRKGSGVNHRTIANITHLPQGCIKEIRCYLKGNSSVPHVEILASKEHGASECVLFLLRKLELDKIIFSRKAQWREDILAMIVGKLVYPGNEVFLTSLFADTVLWESCGHTLNTQPSVDCCYNALSQLLYRKDVIQTKITSQYLEQNSPHLLFLTRTLVEEERHSCELSLSDFQSCRKQYQEFITLLLCNSEGCPLAVKTFLSTEDDANVIQEHLKKMTCGIESFILLGDNELLNKFQLKGLNTIRALRQSQLNHFIDNNLLPFPLSSSNFPYEIYDPAHPSVRYVLFSNAEKKEEQKRVRLALIKKTSELLQKVQKKNQNVGREVEKIWSLFKTEIFFIWHIENGNLHFSVNQAAILQAELLDGCYVIRTDVKKEILSSLKVVSTYQKLHHVQHSFKMIHTISTSLCPISLEDRIHAHVFLSMLSYYLQWHIMKKLDCFFEKKGKIKNRRWMVHEVIERLKSIRTQTIQIGGITINKVRTTLDAEQHELISALGM